MGTRLHFNIVNCPDQKVIIIANGKRHRISCMKVQCTSMCSLLQVCFNKRWGTVNGDRWTDEDTQVSYRQLGFNTEGKIVLRLEVYDSYINSSQKNRGGDNLLLVSHKKSCHACILYAAYQFFHTH